jgi:tRNA pseudouridine55 synthase
MTDGALLLDKPVGMTSNRALQRAKRLCGAAKAGHAGTLDPLASGLLVVLFGEATKFAGPLLDDDKAYRFVVRLGERTATGDSEGEVVERGPAVTSEPQVREALAEFRGTHEQVPPMYSALKHGGRPLYELAREGRTVARAPRRVRVSLLDLLRLEPPELELEVACSKGTYVRTLGEDIARALGTVGHLVALRRIASGAFRVEDACTLDALEGMDPGERGERVLSLGGLLAGLPRAELHDDEEARFRNGQTLPFAGPEGICGVFGAQGRVIGLGRADARGLHPVRLTATQAAESAP